MFRTVLPPQSDLAAAGFGALHLIDDGLVESGLGLGGERLTSTVVPLLWLVLLAVLAARG